MPDRALPTPDAPAPSTVACGLISLAFWFTMGTTAALFALLALAPRLVQWGELEARYSANLAQMQKLRDEISHLQRMAQSLKHDPDYSRRLAVYDLEVNPPGAVMLSPMLAPSPPSAVNAPLSPRGTGTPPWYACFLAEIARPTLLRTRMIGGACLCCLFAFTCLNEAFFAGGIGRGLKRWGDWCTRRYVHRRNSDASTETPSG